MMEQRQRDDFASPAMLIIPNPNAEH